MTTTVVTAVAGHLAAWVGTAVRDGGMEGGVDAAGDGLVDRRGFFSCKPKGQGIPHSKIRTCMYFKEERL